MQLVDELRAATGARAAPTLVERRADSRPFVVHRSQLRSRTALVLGAVTLLVAALASRPRSASPAATRRAGTTATTSGDSGLSLAQEPS
jgi:hypothetical protein